MSERERATSADGDDLRRRLADVDEEIERLLSETSTDDEAERRQVAAAVHGLLDDLTVSGPLADALRPFLDQLRALARWLEAPSAANADAARAGLATLRAVLGPIFTPPVVESDEARRARIKAEVRASLDQIFRRR